MDNLDNSFEEWFNSLGATSSSEKLSSEQSAESQEDTVNVEKAAEVSVQHLSSEDITDILDNLGFQEVSQEQEREEEEEGINEVYEGLHPNSNIPITETEATSYEENMGEDRDLDAEEDEDWNERIHSGEVTPISTNLDTITVPLRQEPTSISMQEDALIPENSPTLSIDESTARFSGAGWYKAIQDSKVIIAGIGGIGSNACFQIARMAPSCMVLYDPDKVETVNMSGQLFSREDVNKFKVDAIASMLRSYTSAPTVYALPERFTSNSETGDIMICGFDNMGARGIFFNAWCKHIENKTVEEKKKCLFLDGRLSIDTLQVLCITGDDEHNIKRYKDEFLFSDAEADETICSMKQTTYLACMIGSVMVNLFTNFIANTLNPVIPYDLPFFTQYEAQHMLFKTEY